ncbi:sigma-70 family RNA polymerase sigma factor [Roseomonas sp. 18066]|uniref:sigma-70 family RNA polymerase sigma factor n=1 Tax=Roseomonas sp. 18066 TaxID=2681412 RepID=UPI00135AA6BC|nr:sigma-70 family RNA polymerase sigma factor [Roseomonas sp. 18066]
MTWRDRWRSGPRPSSPASEFDTVVLAHLDAAYGLARWLVRDPHLAEDVVQEAVLRGLSYFGSFRGDDGRAWFLRIVRNTAYTMLAARRQGEGLAPQGEGLDDDAVLNLPDLADTPDAALSRRQDAAQLEQALAALPVELRECLILKELEELSYKEIARITGVPVGTVMSRLWRARRALIAPDGRTAGWEDGQ